MRLSIFHLFQTHLCFLLLQTASSHPFPIFLPIYGSERSVRNTQHGPCFPWWTLTDASLNSQFLPRAWRVPPTVRGELEKERQQSCESGERGGGLSYTEEGLGTFGLSLHRESPGGGSHQSVLSPMVRVTICFLKIIPDSILSWFHSLPRDETVWLWGNNSWASHHDGSSVKLHIVDYFFCLFLNLYNENMWKPILGPSGPSREVECHRDVS